MVAVSISMGGSLAPRHRHGKTTRRPRAPLLARLRRVCPPADIDPAAEGAPPVGLYGFLSLTAMRTLPFAVPEVGLPIARSRFPVTDHGLERGMR